MPITVATFAGVNTRAGLRLAVLLASGTVAVFTLTHVYRVFHAFGNSGFVGPGGLPSPREPYALAAFGAASACLFCLVGCRVLCDALREG